MKTVFPCGGDIIIIDFDPQRGIEIQKRRPALVISNEAFHRKTNLAFVCPITSTHREIPWHVVLDKRTVTHGEILCEQMKAVDYEDRHWHFVETVPDDLLMKVMFNINLFLENRWSE